MAEPRVNWEELRVFTREVFIRAGVPAEDAAIEAEVIVWANLRGVDSHGVLRIPWYLELIDKGEMKTRPTIHVLTETAATLVIDADHALGPVVTTWAMRRVMAKASDVGIGWGLIKNTTHQGAMGYYPLMAAQSGMAGLAIVCSPPNMAPYGASAAGCPQQSHCDLRSGQGPSTPHARHGDQRGGRREIAAGAGPRDPIAVGVGA